MKRFCFSLAIAIIIIAGARETIAADITFPGYIWGELKTQASPIDDYGIIAEGVFEQAIEVKSFNFFGAKPRLFAEFRYSLNPGGPDWYNKINPGGGLKFHYQFQSGQFEVGVKYNFEIWSGEKGNGAVIGFVNFYRGWNFKLYP